MNCPTEIEIIEYLEKIKIKPLSIRYIKYVAIVLYEDKDLFGILYIFKDERFDGRLNLAKSQSSMNTPVLVLLSSWGDVGKEIISVVAINVTDEQLIEKAHGVKIRLNNGYERMDYLENSKSKIIYIGDTDVEQVNLKEIEIVDINGIEIFKTLYG